MKIDGKVFDRENRQLHIFLLDELVAKDDNLVNPAPIKKYPSHSLAGNHLVSVFSKQENTGGGAMSEDTITLKKDDYNKIVAALMFYSKSYIAMAHVLGLDYDFEDNGKSVFVLSFEQKRFKEMVAAIVKIDTEKNEFKDEASKCRSDFRTSLLASGIVIFLLLRGMWK